MTPELSDTSPRRRGARTVLVLAALAAVLVLAGDQGGGRKTANDC